MECEAYLQQMMPMARWAARRRARPHPLLREDDLLQDAMEALVRVWQRYYPLSRDHLCRIGRLAVLQQLSDVCAHAWCRGEGAVTAWVDLDTPLRWADGGVGGLRVADLVGAGGIEECYFWLGLGELDRLLSAVGRLVLGELLDPGEKTLRAIRWAWRRRVGRPGNWWASARVGVLAESLSLAAPAVVAALGEVRRQAQLIFGGDQPSTSRYRETGGSLTTGCLEGRSRSRGGQTMETQRGIGFIPDEEEVELPEPQKPAVIQARARESVPVDRPANPPSHGEKGAAMKKAASKPKSKVKAKAKPSLPRVVPTPGLSPRQVRTARLAKNLTQAQLGQALGYKDGAVISDIEVGRVTIPTARVLELRKVLGL